MVPRHLAVCLALTQSDVPPIDFVRVQWLRVSFSLTLLWKGSIVPRVGATAVKSRSQSASSFPGEARANGGGERPPQEADAGVAVPEAAAGVQAERRGRGGGGRRGRGHHDDHAEAGGREKSPGELTGAAVKTEGGVKRLPSDVVDDDCST